MAVPASMESSGDPDAASSSLAVALREFVPFEAKLRVPLSRPGLVERAQLMDLLRVPAPERIVLVSAPAGYGKTTAVAQWAERDERAVAWISLTEGDNDPSVLCTYLALALDGVSPLDPTTFAGIAASQADLRTVVLPRLGRAFAAVKEPCVVVLDDAHVLRSEAAALTLQVVTAHVPPASQVVLITRSEPSLPIARLTAGGQVLRIDESHLAMTTAEGRELLAAAGAAVDAATGEMLVARTEGWAAGLYLAALVLRDAPKTAASPLPFTGAEPSISDYFREEVLRALPDAQVSFLLRTSVLERLSAPLCDATVGRSDSAVMLESLARSNLFIVPLDRRGEWFRYHHAFRDMLLAELRRRDWASEEVLRLAACDWLRSHGYLDEAIEQASSASHLETVAALVWSAAPALIASGRTATVRSWLESCSADSIAATPALCVVAAWCAVTDAPSAVDSWLAEAERGGSDDLLPDGTPLAAALALLRALVGRHGLTAQRDEAATAFALDLPGSAYRPIARLLGGSAEVLLGDAASARELLEEGIHLSGTRMPASRAQCFAQLALLAVDDEQWAEAERLVDEAVRVTESASLTERPALAPLYALAALIATHRGATTDGRRFAAHASFLLEALTGVAPFTAVEARALLARASMMLGDLASARVLLDDAEELLSSFPDAGSLPARVARIRRRLDAEVVPIGITVTPLTPAEMRVLRFLPTHLSFAGIADELFVSRNTVKTQAIAIYRKFGVTSRTAAVDTARDIGIIET